MAYKETYEQSELRYEKLWLLENIEERLKKYEEFGLDNLITLFSKLTDEDIEYIVQLAFKKSKVVYTVASKEELE